MEVEHCCDNMMAADGESRKFCQRMSASAVQSNMHAPSSTYKPPSCLAGQVPHGSCGMQACLTCAHAVAASQKRWGRAPWGRVRAGASRRRAAGAHAILEQRIAPRPRRRSRAPPPARPAFRPPGASAGSAWARFCGSAVKTFRTPLYTKRNDMEGQMPVLVGLQKTQTRHTVRAHPLMLCA